MNNYHLAYGLWLCDISVKQNSIHIIYLSKNQLICIKNIHFIAIMRRQFFVIYISVINK